MVGTESEKCAATVGDRLLTPQPVDGRQISAFRRILPQVSASNSPKEEKINENSFLAR